MIKLISLLCCKIGNIIFHAFCAILWVLIYVCCLFDNCGWWLWWRLVHQLHWPGDRSIMKDIRRLDKTAFTSFPLSFYGRLLVFTIMMIVTMKKKGKLKATEVVQGLDRFPASLESKWVGETDYSRTPPRLPIWWWSSLPQDNIGACPYSVLPVFSPVFFTQFSRPYLAHCFYSWNILLPV